MDRDPREEGGREVKRRGFTVMEVLVVLFVLLFVAFWIARAVKYINHIW